MEEKQIIEYIEKWFQENNIFNNTNVNESALGVCLRDNLKKVDRWKNQPRKIQGKGAEEFWEEEWQDMPEFIQEDNMPVKTINVHFDNYEDCKKFSDLVEQKITNKTKSIWFPKRKYIKPSDYIYINES